MPVHRVFEEDDDGWDGGDGGAAAACLPPRLDQRVSVL